MLLSCVLLLFFCILVYIGVCFVKSRRLSYVGTKLNHNDDDDDNVKKNWFYEQYNSSARASRYLVHFFDVHRTVTT